MLDNNSKLGVHRDFPNILCIFIHIPWVAMTMHSLADKSDRYSTSSYTKIKMETYSGEEQERARSSMSPGIPIATIMTANENWRGKNDPAERRRIQNRLNQRAFRQRQRAGESPKQYKPRSMSSTSQQQDDSDEEEDDDEDDDSSDSGSSDPSSSAQGRTASATAGNQRGGVADSQTGRVWDELGQLINRNFKAATVTNAQHLGIDLSALNAGTAARTPRVTNRHIPAALTPVELQHQVPHDAVIDTIPHARLRFNILRAVAQGQIDGAAFCKCIRASGALVVLNGSWQRGGLVVWSSPEQVASWELSEPFVRRWALLLEGCEDLIAATNAWRSRRGERLFPASLNRSER